MDIYVMTVVWQDNHIVQALQERIIHKFLLQIIQAYKWFCNIRMYLYILYWSITYEQFSEYNVNNNSTLLQVCMHLYFCNGNHL